jgi:predicted HicB family RNase H-like nuclease
MSDSSNAGGIGEAADRAGQKSTGHLQDLIDDARTEEDQEESTKRFNVEISEELHRTIKAQAGKEGRSMKDLFLDAIELYLSQRGA